MTLRNYVLNDAVAMALEWGNDWLKPVNDQLRGKYTSLSSDEAEQYNRRCWEIMKYSYNRVEMAYLGQISRDEVRQNIALNYPMLNNDNLARLESQGMYYAWKDNG